MGNRSPTGHQPIGRQAVTLWSSRTSRPLSEEAKNLTYSLAVDKRLAFDDLAGSKAHVKGLGVSGVLTNEESSILLTALSQVEEEFRNGSFEFEQSDEDIHTAIERRVTAISPEVGPKLHTGRSRNDQVACALRLFSKRELTATAVGIIDLQEVLLARAVDSADAYLPGYTHLQRAQPVPLAHYFLAHAWALARDVDRICDCLKRVDVSPLGSGALAGSSLKLDPEYTQRELGFGFLFENSMDAVSDRDFVAETLFDLALLGIHLSRIGQEIVLWSTQEFGFVHLDDSYTTGSSMLPQKKNSDTAELTRAKAGRLIGNLTALLVVLKGLPLSYNRDLQEDKEPLFDSLDQISLILPALAGLLAEAKFDLERMKEAADSPFSSAVDLAEWLVALGMPFRQAHSLIASLVRDSIANQGSFEDFVVSHPSLGKPALEVIKAGEAVRRRITKGGASTGSVKQQIEQLRMRLEQDRNRLQYGRSGSQQP
ncbi:MAG: argininosuccinate lyase [Actinobacteria bacterium]|nr:argininosuccinate lyase [Actinomycetota bacterium]